MRAHITPAMLENFAPLMPLDDFLGRYPIVPSIAVDLNRPDPNKGRVLDKIEVLETALIEAHKTTKENEYHNVEHFAHMFENLHLFIKAYEEVTGLRLSDEEKLSIYFAGLMHDCCHCGATFRSQAKAKEKLFLPELGEEASQEYISMIIADKLAKKLGFSIQARLFISHLIGATTYGGETDEGRRIKIDHIKVTDLFGIAMRLCDVAPPSSITESARRDNDVNIAEIPAAGKPETLKKQMENRIGFLQYIQSLMDSLDDIVIHEMRKRGNLDFDRKLTEATPWQERVNVELKSHSDPADELIVRVLFGGFRKIAEG